MVTVSLVLTGTRLARLTNLEPAEPVQRHGHERPGNLIHIDTEKLGIIELTGHRATGDLRVCSRGTGWKVSFVGMDDQARIGYTGVAPEELQESACHFLDNVHASYCLLGAKPKALLTDDS